jgi:transposase InsO family protein
MTFFSFAFGKGDVGPYSQRRIDYIEVSYNRTRRHSHLGGVSPEAFERPSA